MKKSLVGLITALLVICLAGAVSAATFDSLDSSIANLNISMINQQPDPVEPGNIVEVRFKVENLGTMAAKDVIFEVLPSYPFKAQTEKEAVQNIGTIGPRQVGSEGVIVKVKLVVDKNAIEGSHEVQVRYKSEGNDWIKRSEKFMIDVQTHDAILSIVSVESTPETLEPGKVSKLTMNLKNLGDTYLKDVKVQIGFVRVAATATAITYEEYPFSPVGSSDEKIVDMILSKSTNPVEFNIIADPDAESGVYKIPIYTTYVDNVGNNYSKTNLISLIIAAKPSVNIDSGDIGDINPETKGTVTVKVVNSGLSDVKFAYLSLKDTDAYETLSPKRVYIGKIDSDDYEEVDYDIFLHETKEGIITLPLTLEYKDANNKEYSEVFDLEMRIYTPEEKQKLGLEQKGSAWTGIIIVLVIVGVGVWLYKKRKNKKKTK